MDDLDFSIVKACEAETLLVMAKAFHEEDGHPLSEMGQQAVTRLAEGDPFARGWFARIGGK